MLKSLFGPSPPLEIDPFAISAIFPIRGPFSPSSPVIALVRSFIAPSLFSLSLGLAVEALLDVVADSFSLFVDLSVDDTRDSVAAVFFLIDSAREFIFLPRSAIWENNF